MRDKIIRIEWTEPLLIDEAIASPLSLKPGLYYFTCRFGNHEKSLYVGKATNNIRRRLYDHKWINEYRGKKYVRMGYIVYPPNPDTELLDHAESALIFTHDDILVENTNKRNSYSYSELYRIENAGSIFELKPIIRMHEH